MTGRIKARAGALAAALGLATLPTTEKQAKRTPALAAVRLAGNGDGACIVTITGPVGTISTSIEAEAEGEMALPCERLADLADAFSADAELAITADDNTAAVSSGKSHFKIPTFPIGDLPARHVLGKETGRVVLDTRIARDIFSRVAFAASTEATRFNLNGVFLHSAEGELAAVATDGYRLACATAATSSALSTLSTDRGLIVPREMLKPIKNLLGKASGNVVLRRSDRLFAIEGARFAIVTRLIDSTYPHFERVIPPENPNTATTSRARLTESLARFAAVADPQNTAHAVSLRWNADGLTLAAADGSTDGLAADVEGEAETTIQTRYIAELIEAMRGDGITIATGKPGGPVIFTDPDDANFLALQMPLTQPRPS